MLKMLIRFFGLAGENQAEAIALQTVAFFPLMTLVMRPLGDILADIPATEDADGTMAGPSFDCGRDVAYLPHDYAAWMQFYDELLALSLLADELAGMPQLPQVQKHRIVFMAENLWRMAYNLAGPLALPPPDPPNFKNGETV